jgi:photosystem II stability/assembly factor-like uncharacterized protein
LSASRQETGATWRQHPAPRTTEDILAVAATDNARFALTQHELLVDRGAGWKHDPRLPQPAATNLATQITFSSNTHGLMFTPGGNLYLTKDGGRTWTARFRVAAPG